MLLSEVPCTAIVNRRRRLQTEALEIQLCHPAHIAKSGAVRKLFRFLLRKREIGGNLPAVMVGEAGTGPLVRMKQGGVSDRWHGHILRRSPAGSEKASSTIRPRAVLPFTRI